LPAVTELGLKLALAPAGRPLALSATDWAEPLVTAVLMVVLPAFPWATPRLDGFALMLKSFGAAVTVTVTVVLWIKEPSVPVTVTV
jgi:uncharacterized membrane protein